MMKPTLAEAEFAPGDLVRLRTDPEFRKRIVYAISLRLTGDAETGWEQQTSYGVHTAQTGDEVSCYATDLVLIEMAPHRQPPTATDIDEDEEDDEVEVKLFESDKSLPETEPFEAPPFAEQKDGVW